MCKYCNCRIEWARKDTCAKHCEGAGHKKFKEEAKEKGQSVKRQASLQETYQSSKMARVEKNYFVMATCKAFLEANIPIEKVDNLSLRSWMSEYIPGAGDLPSADMMRKTYIPQVREEEEAFMRQKVKDQQVSILCDETTDRKGQCVFLVLIKILECSDSSKLYVGGQRFYPMLMLLNVVGQ
ncbi:CGG triplet repeat-binding protein 1-like [Ischnura elegans]|nr:CGG triplet repeat-binding protein 1-like [Ischnura elegans]